MKIAEKVFLEWKDQPILHDEDEWGGKYKTYGEMWKGEGYTIGAANIIDFSDQELALLSEGIVRLIRDNCEAKSNGVGGVPDIVTLVKDAQDIDDMCEQL